MMGRRTYTESERREVAARRAALAAAAQALQDGRPADVERAAAILGGYSLRNVALILAQAEERGRAFPAAVAGFHDWRKAGRCVSKGAKGYAIFVPVTRKGADGDDSGPVGFTVRHVFDVADTVPLESDSPATLSELAAAGGE